MKYKFLIVSVFIAFVSVGIIKAQDIVGKWKTIDDETSKAKSIVEIYKSSDGLYYGKIIKLFLEPKDDPNPKCEKCSGDMRNKPLVGLVILKKLKKTESNLWEKGEITDPANGETYDCKASLEKGNLKLRGFIGISLFGRTQTWLPYKD